ncbi:MAG: STAS domain-containing protein [Spirochaetes bacterium]|nr:STAS domain-containing protein [Spirochaetota bacterium]HPA72559.1 STAS domain-containing protein [Spirochaetota bacterium]
MKIEIKESDDLVGIVVNGDIEMMTIKEFKEKLFDIGQNVNKDVELDLSSVDYIDSSGVGVLISLMKLQKKKGKSFKIAKVSSQVMNVLQLSSLSDVFNL